jgi:hypothetical protein
MDKIWRMWLSKNPQPPWIKLCIDTTQTHNPLEFTYITDDNLYQYLPNLRPEVWEISHIVAISEYIRFALVAKYGGLWLDADSVIMHSLEFILRELNNGKMFLLREQLREEEFYDPGFFGAPYNSITMKMALRIFDDLLDQGQREFPWTIGGEILNHAIQTTNPDKFVLHSSLTHPFTCNEQDKVAMPGSIDFINPEAPVIILAAEMFRRYNYGNLQSLTAEEILASGTVISKLFIKSHQNALAPLYINNKLLGA